MKDHPRVRMFAGPNGSGKSTVAKILKPEWLGVYLNPDDLQKEILSDPLYDLNGIAPGVDPDSFLNFLQRSTLLQRESMSSDVSKIGITNAAVDFTEFLNHPKLSYLVAVFADWLRQCLLKSRTSFTFESVMSHPNKVGFFESALSQGWRTYLYYVATEDPEINIGRVCQRVLNHGHAVPEDKIIDRYTRSMQNLISAMQHSSRAYIFDNSDVSARLILESTLDENNERFCRILSDDIPWWVTEYVLNKLAPNTYVKTV